MATTSVLAKLAIQVSANTAEFTKALKESQNTLKGFVNNFNSAAAAIGIGFGVQQITSFAFEISKLAGQAEAVTNQFNRLPGAVYIMQELRKATGETVSEFDLMKTTIKASNFGIELSQLPKLLQFATLRAQQTGQSVDYLVESIIMGIGRKSPMILDNLGISLLEIRERLKGVGVEAASVGDFTKIIGDIAADSLPNMAAFSENAATKVERLTAAWTDLKIAMGNATNESGILGTSVDFLTGLMKVLATESLTTGDKIMLAFDTSRIINYQRVLTQIIINQELLSNTSKKATDDATKEFNNLIKVTKDYDAIRKISNFSLNKQLDVYNEKKKNVIKNIEDEGEREKQVASIVKQKNIYYKDYATTIEKLIEELKNKNQVDPKKLEKELDDAAKIWEKYYQKIENLDKKTSVPGSTLLKEMKAVGLGQLAKKEEPLLEVKTGLEDLQLGKPKWLQDYINAISSLVNQTNIAKGAIEELKSSGSDAMEEFVRSSISNLSELGGMLAVGNISFKDFGRAFLESIANFMKLFGEQLIAIGTAKLALDALFTGITGGIGAIAAGVALIAASGAIKGSIENRLQREQQAISVSRNDYGVGSRSYGNNIEITGTLVGSGRDLVAVINNTNYDNKYRRGG